MASTAMASFWTEFTEYASNPVLDPASGVRAYYPTVLYDAAGFSGHGTASYYKMWFSNGSGIAYAYSDDGMNWTEYNNSASLAGLASPANHQVVLYNSSAFGGSYYYKIWYWTESVNGLSIRYAESTDGITWQNDQAITQHATDTSLQLITGSTSIYDAYFYHCYGPGSVIYNPSATNVGSGTPDNRSDDQPMTYRYVMYYDSSSEGTSTIGTNEDTSLAYSTDGLYWIRYGDAPVLIRSGNAADWDGEYSYRSDVHLINGTYHLWYSGANGDNTIGTYYAHGIGHASSTNGLNWTVDSDNPAFHCTDGVAWRDVRSYTPSVLYDSANFSGHGDSCPIKIWFTGRTGSNYTIGYAYIPASATPPTACFTANPQQGVAPLDVIFNASCSSDTDGTIVQYSWNFGDGNTGTGMNQSHQYQSAGTYTVVLTVRDNDGYTDTVQRTITVTSIIDSCFTSTPDYGYTPLTVSFDASCSRHLGNGVLSTFEWFISGESIGTGINFSYTFTEAGQYSITLLITDSEGRSATLSMTVTVKTVYPPEGIILERLTERSLFKAWAHHGLKWNASLKNFDVNITGYNIYRKLASESTEAYQLIAGVDANTFEYWNHYLPYSNIYSYIIRTVEAGGNIGPPSEEIQNRVED